jgi:hypothetical protein
VCCLNGKPWGKWGSVPPQFHGCWRWHAASTRAEFVRKPRQLYVLEDIQQGSSGPGLGSRLAGAAGWPMMIVRASTRARQLIFSFVYSWW